MKQRQGPQVRFITRPQASLLERIVFFVLGLIVLIAAFFFIGIALIAGAIVAAVFLIRWWWLQRKLRRETGKTWVEGEYTVVESAITDKQFKDKQ
ncbi:MAG: hypothetical protein Q8M53_03660 [Burkholderiales bacterium]|nr:hypothetical protein [Burkholderiales bacterium]